MFASRAPAWPPIRPGIRTTRSRRRESERSDMLLAPYRVLDLTGALGYVCGKVLADLGADVVKIEPPGGDPRDLYWVASNAGKRSVVIDVDSETLRRLIAKADFLI